MTNPEWTALFTCDSKRTSLIDSWNHALHCFVWDTWPEGNNSLKVNVLQLKLNILTSLMNWWLLQVEHKWNRKFIPRRVWLSPTCLGKERKNQRKYYIELSQLFSLQKESETVWLWSCLISLNSWGVRDQHSPKLNFSSTNFRYTRESPNLKIHIP